MKDHVYILEGGYFWKQLPTIALPEQKDLFGNPLGQSRRTCLQHHGLFAGKREDSPGAYHVILTIHGRAIIHDDVTGYHEVTNLQSQIILQVPKSVY